MIWYDLNDLIWLDLISHLLHIHAWIAHVVYTGMYCLAYYIIHAYRIHTQTYSSLQLLYVLTADVILRYLWHTSQFTSLWLAETDPGGEWWSLSAANLKVEATVWGCKHRLGPMFRRFETKSGNSIKSHITGKNCSEHSEQCKDDCCCHEKWNRWLGKSARGKNKTLQDSGCKARGSCRTWSAKHWWLWWPKLNFIQNCLLRWWQEPISQWQTATPFRFWMRPPGSFGK